MSRPATPILLSGLLVIAGVATLLFPVICGCSPSENAEPQQTNETAVSPPQDNETPEVPAAEEPTDEPSADETPVNESSMNVSPLTAPPANTTTAYGDGQPAPVEPSAEEAVDFHVEDLFAPQRTTEQDTAVRAPAMSAPDGLGDAASPPSEPLVGFVPPSPSAAPSSPTTLPLNTPPADGAPVAEPSRLPAIPAPSGAPVGSAELEAPNALPGLDVPPMAASPDSMNEPPHPAPWAAPSVLAVGEANVGSTPPASLDMTPPAALPGETPLTAVPPLTPVAPPTAPSSPAETLAPPRVAMTPAETTDASGETSAAPPKRKSLNGKDDPFDPIAENGEIFVDWEKPDLAIVISGNQNGYLEPCGCAGLNKMKGGLSRRLSFFQDLNAKGWPTVGLDVGGLCKGFGRQAELKLQTTDLAMRQMKYDAIALGTSDLKFPANELFALTASSEDSLSPYMSANAAVFAFEETFTRSYAIIERGGLKIGVTAVLGDEGAKEVKNSNPEIALEDAKKQLAAVLPKLQAAKCDILVLLSHASGAETKALAEAFPQFAIVATSGGGYEPPIKPDMLNEGKTFLIDPGEKGMSVVVLGVYKNPLRLKYQRVPLDSRFENSPLVLLLMQDYQNNLKNDGFEKLGKRPTPHPREASNGEFVGSKKCEACHEPSYDVWKKSGHADAWETLEHTNPPRTYDPECIACHVVGWNQRYYFPYESGYWSMETTPHLVNVGCESCHGPGSRHVKAEDGSDTAEQEAARKAMVVTVEESKKSQCVTCHDGDNSPEFDFDIYWPEIKHSESLDLEDE